MKVRKLGDQKPKVLIFQGSPRDKDTCPNMDSKSHKVVEYISQKWSPFVDFKTVDLAVNQSKKPIIQPCKGCVSTAGGFHCHFPCISPNQRVHMLDGFKEIKDVKIGDILQSGDVVINHLLTSESEMVYELKLTDGRRLEMTKNHKVKVLSKERYRDLNSGWKFYRKENWVELGDIKIGDYIPYIETDNSFNKGEDVSDLYMIYGLIWGDGTFCNNTPLLYVDKKEIEFISEIKNKFQNNIISILEHKINHSQKINPKFEEYSTEMLKINFGTEIGKKMKLIFEKANPKNRRLSIDSFENERQIFNFMNGWISTDGTINKTGGINLYNTSYNCLRDAQLLLSRVGIKSNVTDISHIKTIIRGKENQRCSSLSISDQKSLEILFNNIELLNVKKRNKLSESFKKERRALKHSFSKVKSIKEIGYKPVYDIEVSNSHEFNCEGIKVHNCSCYFKGDQKKPDLLHELGVYDLLKTYDAFIIVSPIHWYSLSSQVKTFFDRLVCTNQSLTIEDAKKIMGPENIKNSEVTGKFARSGKYDEMLRNHLEGKYCAFYVHGDDGANDYSKTELPDSYDVMNDPYSIDPKMAALPYVMQMKYSGVFVPDDLVQAFHINKGVDYYTANKTVTKTDEFFQRADNLIETLLDYLETK